jgi:tetratricopeptide (TPR) repeat protein
LVVIALIALVSSIVLLTMRSRTPPPPAGRVDLLAPPDAFRAAESLMALGQFAEAVPFYRHAIQGEGAGVWIPHAGLAMALRNCSVRRTRFDVDVPILRSSYERVSAAREALAEATTAARLAGRPEQQAAIAQIEGQLLEDWGFIREALAVYRRAQAFDTTGACARRADALVALLRSPAAP